MMIFKVVGVFLFVVILNVRECESTARADGTRKSKFFGGFSRLTGSGNPNDQIYQNYHLNSNYQQRNWRGILRVSFGNRPADDAHIGTALVQLSHQLQPGPIATNSFSDVTHKLPQDAAGLINDSVPTSATEIPEETTENITKRYFYDLFTENSLEYDEVTEYLRFPGITDSPDYQSDQTTSTPKEISNRFTRETPTSKPMLKNDELLTTTEAAEVKTDLPKTTLDPITIQPPPVDQTAEPTNFVTIPSLSTVTTGYPSTPHYNYNSHQHYPVYPPLEYPEHSKHPYEFYNTPHPYAKSQVPHAEHVSLTTTHPNHHYKNYFHPSQPDFYHQGPREWYHGRFYPIVPQFWKYY